MGSASTRTTRTRSPCTTVRTSPAPTAAEGFFTIRAFTRTFPAPTISAASVRVLKNRACHSHLSMRRVGRASRIQSFVRKPMSAAAKGLSGSIRSFL
jgi:hypothetical protein